MSRERLTQLGCLVLTAALVFAAGSLLRPINRQRERMGLSATAEEVESLPPDIAFATIALGGFRGLAVDYLWIRAEMLKEAGRFYEANQLARWICKLQPRFATVWAFQAWNLAWNISVATHTPEERWNWIYNGGVKLLRDEAIKYNPKILSLYRELAWIYFFKMGDYMDDFHWSYKRRWAWEMHKVLGAPPPDIVAERKVDLAEILKSAEKPARQTAVKEPRSQWKPEQQKKEQITVEQMLVGTADPSVRRVIEWFRPIAQAPATWEQLVSDPKMAQFVKLCEQRGIQLRVNRRGGAIVEAVTGEKEVNLRFFDKYQRVLTPTLKQQLDLQSGKIKLTDDEKALKELLEKPDTKPLAERLLAFMRRYVLVHKYKLDPQWMLALMERFGPLDWRVPESHGIYWTSYGVKQMRDLDVKDVQEFFGPNTSLNTDRLMLFALQKLTFFGRLFFEPDVDDIDRSYIDLLPDLRFVEATHRAFLLIGKKYDPTVKNVAGEDIRDGHINYLRDAIRLFYLFGEVDKAQHYYDYLRLNYRQRNGKPNPDYMVPLAEFVTSPEFRDRLSDPKMCVSVITTYLQRAFRMLAAGDARKAVGLIRYAKKDLYDWYMDHWRQAPTERMKLPPFTKIFNDAVTGILNAPGGVDSLVMKIRLWRALPVETQLEVYDSVSDALRKQCALAKIDMSRAFPAPPGLAEYRLKKAKTKPKKAEYTEGVQSLLKLKQDQPSSGD